MKRKAASAKQCIPGKFIWPCGSFSSGRMPSIFSLGCCFQSVKDASSEKLWHQTVWVAVNGMGPGAATSVYSSPLCTPSKNSFEARLLIPILPDQGDSRDKEWWDDSLNFPLTEGEPYFWVGENLSQVQWDGMCHHRSMYKAQGWSGGMRLPERKWFTNWVLKGA